MVLWYLDEMIKGIPQYTHVTNNHTATHTIVLDLKQLYSLVS